MIALFGLITLPACGGSGNGLFSGAPQSADSTIRNQHVASSFGAQPANPLPVNAEGIPGCTLIDQQNDVWDCASNCTNVGLNMTCTTSGGPNSTITIPGGSAGNYPQGGGVINPNFPGGASGYKPPSGGRLPPLTAAQKRWSKALLYKGTLTTAGPDAGFNACVWAINQVQVLAGLLPFPVGNSVPNLRDWLASGNGHLVDTNHAVAGDLVINGDGRTDGNAEGHVGICVNNGCSLILSNGNSYGPAFAWQATQSQFASGTQTPNLPNGIWHVDTGGY